MLKFFVIIILNSPNISTIDVAKKIGYNKLHSNKITSGILAAGYEDGVSIGKYNDMILIVSSKLVFKFYDKKPSEFEKKISSEFPKSEIAILMYNGMTECYGYNIINKGNRKRVKEYCEGAESYIDYGKQLTQEILIAKDSSFQVFREKVKKTKLNNYVKEEIIKQEMTRKITIELFKSYFGKSYKHFYKKEEVSLKLFSSE